MNSLVNIIIDSDIEAQEMLCERYFVATTPRGPCVVNYTPGIKDYVGGPFLTWDGAYAYIDIHIKRKRGRLILMTALATTTLAIVSAIAVPLIS